MTAPAELLHGHPDRLVPHDFIPNQIRELAAVRAAFPPDPFYPTPVRMTPREIKALDKMGRNFRIIWRNHPALITNHPNYLEGLALQKAQEDNGIQNFPPGTFQPSLLYGDYPVDSRGVPLHPDYKRMLAEGAVAGIGRYWTYGPNHLARAVVLGHDENNTVHALVYEKEGRIMLPGGNVDKGEEILAVAVRETREETGLEGEIAYKQALRTTSLAPGRVTLNAWEECTSVIVGLEDQMITNYKLTPEKGIDRVFWMPLTTDTLDSLFLPHANDVRLAVLAYEERNNRYIDRDGTIHKFT